MKFAEDAVFLAVGSNLDPLQNVPRALEALFATDVLSVLATSTFYRTKPVARPGQPVFANGVWRIATDLAPRALKFEVLRKLEADLGRVRTDDRHAPRPIDLDMILYGDAVLDTPALTLPDPAIRVRPFVAEPLRELVPMLCLPDTGEGIKTIADRLGRGTMEPWNELTDHLRRLLS